MVRLRSLQQVRAFEIAKDAKANDVAERWLRKNAKAVLNC